MKKHSATIARKPERRGGTLTEVLIAMMIMAIGVTMVMSLFPVSALRTLQATQLTNATILCQNVKALIEIEPGLVFDPDFDGDLTEHYSAVADRNYVVDPVGYFVRYTDNVLTDLDGMPSTPDDTFGGATGIPRFGAMAPFYSYPMDPSGDPDYSGKARALLEMARSVGTQGDGWTIQYDGLPEAGGLIQETGTGGVIGLTLDPGADLSAIPYSNHPTQGVPLVGGSQSIPDRENSRVVVFSTDGSISQAFPLTQISEDIDHSGTLDAGEDSNGNSTLDSNVIFWTEDLDYDGVASGGDIDFDSDSTLDLRALPEEFYVDTDGDQVPDTPEIGRVMLLTRRASDFNWLLTVRRRSDGVARSVDVVVRYKDSVDADDEQTFRATFVPNTAFVGIDIGSAEAPEIRKGSFVFNVTQAKWYRVLDMQERPALGWTQAGAASQQIDNNYEFVLRLDENVRGTDSAGVDGANGLLDGVEITDWTDSSSEFGLAMFPTGVVEVYPIGYMSP